MEQLSDIIFASFITLLFIACLYLYIRAVVDIHKRKFQSLRDKSFWLTLVIVAPLFGSIFYFTKKRPQPGVGKIP